MKIRNGFVSNSSSSSFIIGVPKDVAEDKAKLKKYLFGNNEVYPNPYIWDSDDIYSWPAEEVTNIVFDDIHKEGPIDHDRMVEEYSDGYTPTFEQSEREVRQSMGIGRHDWSDGMFKKIAELNEQKSKEVVDQFIQDNANCQFYVVNYSDNDGVLSTAMEHGCLFDFIPCLKVSHH